MNKGSGGVIVIILVALVAGFAGYQIGAGSAGVRGSGAGGRYFSADEVARLKTYFPAFPGELRSVSGTVEKIAGNAITLKTTPPFNPFEPLPDTYIVRVTAETVVVRNDPKDPDVFRRETDAYAKAAASRAPADPANPPPAAPYPFAETKISLDDVPLGAYITAETDANAKIETTFDATRISLSAALAPTAVGAPLPAGIPATTPPPPVTP